MVATRKVRKIVCCVVRVPEQSKQSTDRHQTHGDDQLSLFNNPRPSDLLPWADPYISQLVRNLQHEVRRERSHVHRQRSMPTSPVAEMQPPSPHMVLDWQKLQEKRSDFQNNPSKGF